MKTILASHNSFTFLKPKKWYMTPFNFISKCQSKTIEEQYNLGTRYFDLRVSFNKFGNVELRHGLMIYKGGMNEISKALTFLNERPFTVYVRVIHETNKYKDTNTSRELFTMLCIHLENTYKKIKFLDGRTKYNWEEVYSFNNSNPELNADFSSVKGSKLNDLWPWLYAKTHNKKAIENNSSKYLMLDFVNIQ